MVRLTKIGGGEKPPRFSLRIRIMQMTIANYRRMFWRGRIRVNSIGITGVRYNVLSNTCEYLIFVEHFVSGHSEHFYLCRCWRKIKDGRDNLLVSITESEINKIFVQAC